MFNGFIWWLDRCRQPKVLIEIRGISGSGKSTLANLLTPNNVAADDYPNLYKGGVYNIELQQASHEWCLSRVEDMMRRGDRIIAVHNTFVKVKYLQPFEDLADRYGYRVQVVHCEGNYGNVHGVSDEILKRQAANWENYS